jgi:hypothetical protein
MHQAQLGLPGIGRQGLSSSIQVAWAASSGRAPAACSRHPRARSASGMSTAWPLTETTTGTVPAGSRRVEVHRRRAHAWPAAVLPTAAATAPLSATPAARRTRACGAGSSRRCCLAAPAAACSPAPRLAPGVITSVATCLLPGPAPGRSMRRSVLLPAAVMRSRQLAALTVSQSPWPRPRPAADCSGTAEASGSSAGGEVDVQAPASGAAFTTRSSARPLSGSPTLSSSQHLFERALPAISQQV